MGDPPRGTLRLGDGLGETVESYLGLHVRDRSDATVMTVTGELDMASSPQLIEALERLDLGRRPVVLDLSGLEFIDLSGLRALLAARERARRAGTDLTVVKINRGVRRLLKLTGTSGLLERVEAP